MATFDIIVIGAGIAGASVATHLSKHSRVCILEMEERAGYHTTGRSAASYEPNYGPPPMLAFSRASDSFFRNPHDGFADGPLLTDRVSLFFEAAGQMQASAELLALSTGLQDISEAQARLLFPVLREGYAKRIFLDPNTADIDVDLLHRGYLRQFKSRGGALHLRANVQGIERVGGQWQVRAGSNDFVAPILINAAGAWGDVVSALASVKPVGLVPKRRSIAVVPAPVQAGFGEWPMVTDVGETWYAKPQSGKLLVSSADATPVEPHDAYADDLAIAEGVDRLMQATTLEVERLEHSWGGLRTFAPDGNPVVGFDPSTDGFFWLVGQGGYGIQSAPALSRTAAEMATGKPIPQDVIDFGLDPQSIVPDRFHRS